jgi:hypothetical protein
MATLQVRYTLIPRDIDWFWIAAIGSWIGIGGVLFVSSFVSQHRTF